MQMSYHNPVLLNEGIQGLNIKENGVYVDVTFGGGGHSKEILNQLGPDGKLFGFDQDKDAQQNSINDNRFVLIPENFRYISRFLRFHQVKKVDGILADLGVSSFQFDSPERGFSTRFDAELDMRMNQSDQLSAVENQEELPQIVKNGDMMRKLEEEPEVDHKDGGEMPAALEATVVA